MKISPEMLAAQAEATGFRPDMLEKVGLLLQLLGAVRSIPPCKGTAASPARERAITRCSLERGSVMRGSHADLGSGK